MYKAQTEPSEIQKLWIQAKETESLYKLVEHLSSLPSSERRDSLLAVVRNTISSPIDVGTGFVSLNSRIKDLENQVCKAERERDEAMDYIDQLKVHLERVGEVVPEHVW